MIEFVKRYRAIFEQHELFATGTTGRLISEIIGLKVHRFLSGPLGGDQQIGAKLAEGEVDMIIFYETLLQPNLMSLMLQPCLDYAMSIAYL